MISTYDVTNQMYGDDVAASRTSPRAWSVDAEQATLGACLLSADAIATIRELHLAPEHFADRTHQAFFRAILALDDAGTVVDPLTVTDWLVTRGESDDIRDAANIIADSVMSANAVANYAAIVLEFSQRRVLQKTADTLASAALDRRNSVADALDFAEQQLHAARPANSVGVQAVKSLIVPAMQLLEERTRAPGALTGIPTPFDALNDMTLGLHPCQLIVCAARPSIGKTAIAIQTAITACKAGHRVLFCSLEMSASELFERIWSIESAVPLMAIRGGTVTDYQTRMLATAAQTIKGWRLGIDDMAGASIGEIRSRARRANPSGKEPIGLIIVDYLQLVSCSADNRQNEVAAVSRGLKALAKELRVPVLALSQLSRQVELRGKDAEPQLSDLRDSGAIEQDADVVLFLHRPTKGQPNDTGQALAILAKQRQGPLGRIPLQFRGSIAAFDTGVPPHGYGRVHEDAA